MKYEEYKNNLIENLKNHLNKDEVLETRITSKVNRGKLEGISLRKMGSNVSAVLYIEDLYEDQVDYATVMTWLRSAKGDIYNNFETPDIDDLMEKGYFRMCNSERNKAMLKDSITLYYPELEDIALYAVYPVAETTRGFGYVRLTPEMMKEMHVSNSVMVELKERMIQNTANLITVRPLREVIAELSGGEFTEDSPFIVARDDKTMASAFVKPIMKQFKKNVYVIPSSTAELLFIYEDEVNGHDESYMKHMIREINENVVEDELFLSNNLFKYDAESEKISVV